MSGGLDANLAPVFESSTLDDLRVALAVHDIVAIRTELIAAFDRRCRYRDVVEWNEAVRICEALAIVGWGHREPLEAVSGVFWSGNPTTTFLNRSGARRYLDAIWSKRKAGLSIDRDRSRYWNTEAEKAAKLDDELPTSSEPQPIKLASQRNWIQKCPIIVQRFGLNCLPTSEEFNLDVEHVLGPMLEGEMRVGTYGAAINWILIRYYLVDEPLQTNEDVVPSGPAFSPQALLRKPSTVSPFRTSSGSLLAHIHFARSFSLCSTAEQKRIFVEHVSSVLELIAKRLARRKIDFDFQTMRSDFTAIVYRWASLDSSQLIASLPAEKNAYKFFRELNSHV